MKLHLPTFYSRGGKEVARDLFSKKLRKQKVSDANPLKGRDNECNSEKNPPNAAAAFWTTGRSST